MTVSLDREGCGMPGVVITGGSRGIGAAMVRLFAQKGWRVLFTWLNSEKAAADLASETGAAAFHCDVRREEDIDALYREAKRLFPHGPQALVCNARVAHAGLLQDVALSEWEEVFAVNVRGAFLAIRAFLPDMIREKRGSVVCVSSMWGQTGASCEAAYSASKAALIGLTRAMAREAGPSGVRFNCVCPGVIRTDMLKDYTQEDLEALRQETPLLRLGTPEDVARSVYFLCGEDASFITGQALGVSGGFVV